MIMVMTVLKRLYRYFATLLTPLLTINRKTIVVVGLVTGCCCCIVAMFFAPAVVGQFVRVIALLRSGAASTLVIPLFTITAIILPALLTALWGLLFSKPLRLQYILERGKNSTQLV